MERYTDRLLPEHNPKYDIGPRCVITFVDSEKKIQTIEHPVIMEIIIPLHSFSNEELSQIKTSLKDSMPNADEEWIIDGGSRGLGLFRIKKN